MQRICVCSPGSKRASSRGIGGGVDFDQNRSAYGPTFENWNWFVRSFAPLARPKLVSIIEKFGIFMVISCEANHFSGVWCLVASLERGTQKLPDFNHLVLCWPIDYIDLCLEPNAGRHDEKRNEPDCWLLLRLRGVEWPPYCEDR